MTGKDPTERFVIEVGREGTADHVIDLDASTAAESTLLPSVREMPGEMMCDRGTRWPEYERIALPDYADWQGLDTTSFEGDAPGDVCSYCWSKTVKAVEDQETRAATGANDRIGEVGYRLRWKQKGRARDEWYDVVVRPETTMAELDRLVCRFTTLDDFHLRLYGLENEYLDSSLGVFPDHQYDEVGRPSQTRASDVTIAEIAEQAGFWEGDRLSLVYDFGTPSYFYCIVKEVYDPGELDDVLAESDPVAETDTAAIVREKRP